VSPYRRSLRDPLYVRNRLEELRARDPEYQIPSEDQFMVLLGHIKRIYRRLDALEEALAEHLAACG
jgi:hypothetical protein